MCISTDAAAQCVDKKSVSVQLEGVSPTSKVFLATVEDSVVQKKVNSYFISEIVERYCDIYHSQCHGIEEYMDNLQVVTKSCQEENACRKFEISTAKPVRGNSRRLKLKVQQEETKTMRIQAHSEQLDIQTLLTQVFENGVDGYTATVIKSDVPPKDGKKGSSLGGPDVSIAALIASLILAMCYLA